MIKSDWEPIIVLLSIGIAFIGSYGGITLYEQFRLCSKENRPKLLSPSILLALMALSLGGVAIWCMHFVGMAAMKLYDESGNKISISYRIDLTLTSLVAVIFFLYIGLQIGSSDRLFTNDKSDTIEKFVNDARSMSIQEIRKIQHKHIFLVRTLFQNMLPLFIGGMFTACGVCVMHYIGMAAMVAENMELRWNEGIVAASVIIAIVAATAAYWILFRLLALYPYMELLRVSCAMLMAFAVNGMHYTGMAAATFTACSTHPSTPTSDIPRCHGSMSSTTASTVDQDVAVMCALAVSMVFMWTIFILSMADLRVWYYNLARIVREADIRMTLHKANGELERQPFLREYEEIRNSDGNQRAIVDLRHKLKGVSTTSTSPSNSLMMSSIRSLTSSVSLRIVPTSSNNNNNSNSNVNTTSENSSTHSNTNTVCTVTVELMVPRDQLLSSKPDMYMMVDEPYRRYLQGNDDLSMTRHDLDSMEGFQGIDELMRQGEEDEEDRLVGMTMDIEMGITRQNSQSNQIQDESCNDENIVL